ncbi:MAG TPA: hypothetical protein VEJ40_00020 [Pseudolabrys sp.]|jgi:hypothetical protein|nr:hypothetical protein [Pseudolabrys sp.]
MGKVIVLGIYIAMMIGGVLTLILQVLYFPVLDLEHAAISVVAALAGAVMLWVDFLR